MFMALPVPAGNASMIVASLWALIDCATFVLPSLAPLSLVGR